MHFYFSNLDTYNTFPSQITIYNEIWRIKKKGIDKVSVFLELNFAQRFEKISWFLIFSVRQSNGKKKSFVYDV